jgi:cytochrome oxidase Cu insertion factor (SCO1/SenC/PrrC family)
MTKHNALITVAARTTLIAVALIVGIAVVAPAAFAQSKPAARAKQPATGDYYTCVMHPEVKEKKPGNCPKCNMALRLKHAAPPTATKDAATEETTATISGALNSVAVNSNAYHTSGKMTIPDVELLDQDGRKIHFYSDLVKGKTVAINFIFTTCTTICPPLGATFRRVEQELGERAGRDVRLISISVDPATDTPERLKAWGAKFHAGAGWTFVTGAKPLIDELLRALGAQTARPEDHSPTVLIGNDARGQWTRTYGLARPTQLVEMINDALAGQTRPVNEGISTAIRSQLQQ